MEERDSTTYDLILVALAGAMGVPRHQVPKPKATREPSRYLEQLRDLLEARKRSRVVGNLKVEADGSLAGEPLPQDPADERAGLHSENQTVIYPSDAVLYPHSSVVRLYK